MRRLVAFLAGVVVLVALSLLASIILPTVQYQSGNHEIATTLALAGGFLTSAIVYSLYPHLRRNKRK